MTPVSFCRVPFVKVQSPATSRDFLLSPIYYYTFLGSEAVGKTGGQRGRDLGQKKSSRKT